MMLLAWSAFCTAFMLAIDAEEPDFSEWIRKVRGS